jgi:penicillin amidase
MRSRHGGIMLKLKNRRNQDRDSFEILQRSVAVLEKQLGKSVPAWTWNKVHVVEYEHALGKVALLRRIFNVGPFEVSGSNEVINNQMFDYTNESKYVKRSVFSTSYRFFRY